jgi:hypothetical protein
LEHLALFVLPSTDLAAEDDMSDEEREIESDAGDSDSECVHVRAGKKDFALAARSLTG